ncbi:MAG: hypothetical protein ACYCXH_07760, partial [Bellilinea sp.]
AETYTSQISMLVWLSRATLTGLPLEFAGEQAANANVSTMQTIEPVFLMKTPSAASGSEPCPL